MKKFELSHAFSTTYRGRTLFRIKALKNFTTSSPLVVKQMHLLKRLLTQVLTPLPTRHIT